jgi:hypothetical protein
VRRVVFPPTGRSQIASSQLLPIQKQEEARVYFIRVGGDSERIFIEEGHELETCRIFIDTPVVVASSFYRVHIVGVEGYYTAAPL